MKEKKIIKKNNQKNKECSFCKISEESIDQLKKAGRGADLYKCPECGFWYKEKEWSEKCEAWCKEHKSCNLEIVKHAIKK